MTRGSLTDALEETLACFGEAGAPRTTREVADALELGRRSTYDRLDRLVECDHLETKRVGASARVWWRPTQSTTGRPAQSTTGRPAQSTTTDRPTPARDADTEYGNHDSELEQYRAAVETVEDGVYVVDDESRFLLVNDAHAELTGYDREALLGAHATRVTTDDDLDRAEQHRDELETSGREVATVETELLAADGRRIPVETRFALFPLGDDRYGRAGVVRDISDRLDHEHELERRVRQQEAVAELGHRALGERDVDDLLADAAVRVAGVLGADYCKVLDLDPEASTLRLRQGVGWDDGIVGTATVSADENDSQAAHTLAAERPVVVEDLAAETRFSGPDLLTGHDVRSGISVPIGPRDDPWGILGVHDTDPRTFSERDVAFVQSIANVLGVAIERHSDERELLVQREQLAALDNLNRTLRETTEAVIEQSTREEVERTVCEHLAATDSYEFAWIGDVDVATDTVNLRTEAGVEGYLEDITVTVDPDDERSHGPTGRALRTGAIQTTGDVSAADDHDPWRDHVGQYDFRSSAAVPITHGDTTYGVLNVYAGRRRAFAGPESEVLTQLGEIVGHAIAATDRKQTLMGDRLVELEFQIRDVFAALDVPATSDGTITLDHTVPVGDDEFLVYGTATPDAVDTLTGLVEALPHWESVTIGGADNPVGPVDYEARLADPPVLSVVAACGGEVQRAVIEDGDYRMTVHLAPSVEVRRIIDAVESTYPTAELLRRQGIDRPTDGPQGIQRRLTTDLTDRQHSALEAAHHAGFFEWPRDADGADVADSLDVAPSTFHQHLRKAERKVFESLFATHPPA